MTMMTMFQITSHQ